MATPRVRYQTPETPKVDRTDCVWVPHDDGWKCCLCGCVVAGTPPPYPTPAKFLPRRFELPLTADERALCPEQTKDAA